MKRIQNQGRGGGGGVRSPGLCKTIDRDLEKSLGPMKRTLGKDFAETSERIRRDSKQIINSLHTGLRIYPIGSESPYAWPLRDFSEVCMRSWQTSSPCTLEGRPLSESKLTWQRPWRLNCGLRVSWGRLWSTNWFCESHFLFYLDRSFGSMQIANTEKTDFLMNTWKWTVSRDNEKSIFISFYTNTRNWQNWKYNKKSIFILFLRVFQGKNPQNRITCHLL